MGFRAMICTLAMTLLGVAGMGNADTYTCKITKSSRGGWVTQDYIFVVDAQNRASVYDGAVHFAYGKPIWATITERTDSITRLTWGVAGLPASNRATGSSAGKFSLKYSAVLNTAKQTVSVRGTVMQGGGGSNGSGTCKVKAGGSAANALSTTTGNASIPDKSGPGGGASCEQFLFSRTNFECQ